MTDTTPLDTHPLFQDRLRQSEVTRKHVGDWLKAHGYSVYLPPLKIAPTHAQWRQYVDGGDLYVKDIRFEVKHCCKVRFLSREQWPWKWAIVCRVDAWENAQPKPRAVIACSQDLRACYITFATKRRFWREFDVWDAYYKKWQTVYKCPVGELLFLDFGQSPNVLFEN